jgi:hypothetical protein
MPAIESGRVVVIVAEHGQAAQLWVSVPDNSVV